MWSIDIKENKYINDLCMIYLNVYLAKLQCVTNLDFPEIRGFPFLSYLLGLRSCEVAIIWPTCLHNFSITPTYSARFSSNSRQANPTKKHDAPPPPPPPPPLSARRPPAECHRQKHRRFEIHHVAITRPRPGERKASVFVIFFRVFLLFKERPNKNVGLNPTEKLVSRKFGSKNVDICDNWKWCIYEAMV